MQHFLTIEFIDGEDLWALGCLLYEMATGKRAFEGNSQASLIAAIMGRQPPEITVLKPLCLQRWSTS